MNKLDICCVYPPHIYVSSYSAIEDDADRLNELAIKRVLSFDSSSTLNHLLTRVYRYDVTTIPTANNCENLKPYFPQMVRFISRCILRKENVLVCSEKGNSRSIIAVLSYLAAREHVSVGEGLEIIKKYKPEVEPNPNFIKQLEEYMVEKEQESSRATMNKVLVSSDNSSVRLAREIREGLHLSENQSENNAAIDVVYCKKCRFELFTVRDLVTHNPEGRGKKDFSFKKTKKDIKSSTASLKKDCNAYFIEKKSWMSSMSTDSGDIFCPKCEHRIGSFKWSGLQCSCGVWVRPAIQILKSRTDTSVFNRERTLEA
jgi:protein-tyrosine phosphatase